MTAFLAISLILATDVDLSLAVNDASLGQRDPLIMRAVLKNLGPRPLAVPRPGLYNGNPIRFQQKIDGRWVHLLGVGRQSGAGGMEVEGRGTLLAVNAAVAEYPMLLLDQNRDFYFETPGQYEFRAVLETSGGPVASQSVRVTVERRPREQLDRIDDARDLLCKIGRPILSRDIATKKRPDPQEIPEELIALQDVSGNIGQGVQNMLLAQRILRGEEKFDTPLREFLRKRLSGVDRELALLRLGHHYYRWGQWPQLKEVLDALPHATLESPGWRHAVELHMPKPKLAAKPGPQE